MAPEFQIFTGPWGLGLVNALTSVVRFGLSKCGEGAGADKLPDCVQGNLTWTPETVRSLAKSFSPPLQPWREETATALAKGASSFMAEITV